MIINRTHGGKASSHIIRTAIGISVLTILLLAGLVNAQETCNPGVTPPTISSVSGQILPSALGWSITINGACFGNVFPMVYTQSDGSVTTQPSTITPAIVLINQGTSGTVSNWGAGFGNDLIGIYLASWTDNAITINGFGSSYVPSRYGIASGDQIFIYIVGSNCHASTTPQWPTISDPPPPSVWPSNCLALTSTTVSSSPVPTPTPIPPPTSRTASNKIKRNNMGMKDGFIQITATETPNPYRQMSSSNDLTVIVIIMVVLVIYIIARLIKWDAKCRKENAEVQQKYLLEKKRQEELEKRIEENKIETRKRNTAAKPMKLKIRQFLKENIGEHFSELDLRSNMIKTATDDEVFDLALERATLVPGFRWKTFGNSNKRYYYYVNPEE